MARKNTISVIGNNCDNKLQDDSTTFPNDNVEANRRTPKEKL